jgi:pyrophosphate--fructose-6-phosphate 1-phosphotransferase
MISVDGHSSLVAERRCGVETGETISEEVARQVTKTEGRHSIFEEEVRKMSLPVCPVFLGKDGGIIPAHFRETNIALTMKTPGQLQRVFPKTLSKTKNIVLEGIPDESLRSITGKRVAVLFSGGPAAGGHNVLAGLKAALGKGNSLFGIRKGPIGLLNGDLFEIRNQALKNILNTGGFDFLGTDRTKIKTQDQFEKLKQTVLKNRLDGLVIVGGDDSNTNAAFVAEYFENESIPCSVIGIPKTIDGGQSHAGCGIRRQILAFCEAHGAHRKQDHP